MWWGVAGRRLSWMCGGRGRFSSAPWSRSSILCLWSRCFTTLCRRWWNSWWTFLHLLISVLPSRLSRCPRSCVHHALLAQSSVRRRRQNSWWKCRRCCLILRLLPSRPLTFQFRVVQEEGGVEVFKVFLDRIQQRLLEQIVLTFRFRAVEVFQALAQDRVQQLSSSRSGIADEAGLGVFRTFPRGKKVRG